MVWDGSSPYREVDVVAIDIRDLSAPVIPPPPDVVRECRSSTIQFEFIQPPAFADICDAQAQISTNASFLFAEGATPITWTARDAAGNSSTQQQIVRIEDRTPPTVVQPQPVVNECVSTSDQSVLVFAPAAFDACDSTLVTTSDKQERYALGAHVIHWRIEDDAGNFSSLDQPVIIRDTLGPALAVQAEVTVECSSPTGQPVQLAASTLDLCDAFPVLSNDAPPLYHLGERVVTWTSRDATQNESTAQSRVTVLDRVNPLLGLSSNPIWAPLKKGKYANVHINASAYDACTAQADLPIRLESITVEEPGGTDPISANAILDAEIGTADFDVRLATEKTKNATPAITMRVESKRLTM